MVNQLNWIHGDVSLYSTGSLAVSGLQGRPVDPGSPGTGNALVWTGSEWSAGAGGGGTVFPAPLTSVNDANVTATLTGNPASAVLASTTVTMGWSGQLTVSRGGTGLATVSPAQILIGQAGNTLAANTVAGDASLAASGTLVVTGLQARPIYSGSPVSNNVLVWSGTQWSSAPQSGTVVPASFVSVNDTNVTASLTGSPSNALLQNVSLTMGWSGALSVSRGGTGLATVSPGQVIIGQAANAYHATVIAGDASLASSGTLIVSGLQGNPVSTVSPSTGNALIWSGSIWVPNPTPLGVASGNINFYLNPSTGNDSNSGLSSGSPVATIQRAVDLASGYNYLSAYYPIYNLADGTYTNTGGAFTNITPMYGLGSANNMVFVGNNANPQSVIISNSIGMYGSGGDLGVTFGGMTFAQNTYSNINPVSAFCLINGPIRFTGTGYPFYLEGEGLLYAFNQTLTLTNGTIPDFIYAVPGCAIFVNCTIDLPATLTVSDAFVNCAGYMGNTLPGVAQVNFNNITWANKAGVSGTALKLATAGLIVTDNGAVTDIPGSGYTSDGTGILAGGGRTGFLANQNAGIPSASNLGPGTSGVFKDTSGGGVYLAYNDAGTIKKVALT